MIGSLQWAVSLGRVDIQTATIILSSFISIPRESNLDRVKRMYSYVSKMRHAAIGIRTEELDVSALPEDPNTWDHSVYGNMTEKIPEDIPKPSGKHVVTTHYEDVNLLHDIMTGRSVTGILHFINKTTFDWYSKS